MERLDLFIEHNEVSAVELFQVGNRVLIDSDTLHGLNIICEERHPSLLRTSSTKKEGYSVLALLDRTRVFHTSHSLEITCSLCRAPSDGRNSKIG